MDLAKREIRSKARTQRTFRRETTMPRGKRDLPAKEVNARIHRPDTSDADALARILGMANDVGQRIIADDQERRDNRDAGDAALDFSSGAKDDKRFERSRAYRDAWQLEGAKKLAIDVGNEVAQKVTERLNDSDNPATIEEIDGLVEQVFKSHVFDEDGNLLDFGTPAAKMVLARAMHEVRSKVLPQAQAAIKEQTDDRLLLTMIENGLTEHVRGAPIGAEVDPLAPLSDSVDALAPLPEGTAEAPRAPVRVSLRVGRPEPRAVASVLGSTFPAHVVAGFLGNFEVEGGYNGSKGDGGKAAGIAQWHADRQANFRRVIGKPVTQATLEEQARFVVWEMQNPRAAGMTVAQRDAILNAKSAAQAAELIDKYYERSSGKHRQKRIDAANRFAGGATPVTSDGSEPELVAQGPSSVQAAIASFDFEGLMKRLPPSIDKGKAKKVFLQRLFSEANAKGDIGLLAGLEESVRADGTPSFTPDERLLIQNTRDAISDKLRVKADRAEKERYDENVNRILEAMLSDDPPSDEWISNAALNDLIPDDWAWSLIRQREQERKTEERERRQEERQALYEERAAVDAWVASQVALRESGLVADQGIDKALLDSGRLGDGKFAIAHYNRLRAANRAGEQRLEQNPQAAYWAGQLKERFEPKAPGSSAVESRRSSGTDAASYAALVAGYNAHIRGGMDPAQAYLKAISEWAPKAEDKAQARRLLIQRMAEQRARAGR